MKPTTSASLTGEPPDAAARRVSHVGFGVSCVAAALAGALLGDGVRSPAFGLCALAVCVAGAVAGLRHAIGLAALVAVELAALALAEAFGLLPAPLLPAPLLATPWWLGFSVQLLGLAAALAGAGLIFELRRRQQLGGVEHEQRFNDLLRMAGDIYWELDRGFRFSRVTPSGRGAPTLAVDELLNRTPWQVAALGLSAERLDAHRADLEAHRPFTGLLLRCLDASGQVRTHSMSGEPAFDAQGGFRGYWGVIRDVSDDIRKQRAVTASETRYRELFTRSPSPLLLHRQHVVFDANEAAARLFGFANAAAMNGFNLTALFPAGEARDHAVARLHQLERLSVGEGLPVADFQIRSIDARPLSVQATGVRIDTASGPANLAIFFDITVRQAVEGALRRSEAMLSHLFATSPDCIALTEMATSRYAMVNPAFCQLTGFTSEEVVGRTAAELGLWHDQHTADRLMLQLERNGRVHDLAAVFMTKTGSAVSMRLAAGRFVMDGRDYLVVNARDVTDSERTRLEHAAILERASIGIAFTRDHHFVQANPYFERMFGFEPGRLIGRPAAAAWPHASDDAAIDLTAAPLLAAGQPFEVERELQRADGSAFWCRLLAQAVDRSDPSRGGTIWIAEDVTERRRLDQALAAARDAAEAASRAKSAFLANTSHEIRTPLNGLLGLARLAMQEDLLDARRQQYLAQILDSAQSLAGIMSDILDVSKIEAGKITLEDLPFDLRELLTAVHHAYQPLADVKGLTLRLDIADAVPRTVRGDPVRVRQILSNFITNALKFTERGEVRIDASVPAADSPDAPARSEPDAAARSPSPVAAFSRVRLAVTDTGPGIPPEARERLFAPFSQGDSSTTRRYGGTGLGLSICRELARLMGGEAGLQSRPGQGSSFWAELPLSAAEPEPDAVITGPGDISRLYGARVLMVEDNPVNMMIAVAMLEHWGVLVSQAFDGRAAVDAVHAAHREGRPYDAVLMDVQMPVMGGHEAARELRLHYPADALPIIALTAAALVSERQEALASGMNDFLTKPIDAPKFRDTLAQHVRKRAATDE